ncbi:MAG: hypothetical protein ACYTGQ_02610 [Planctomycetota bacterium]|jgi:hypothetical protein
MNDDTYDDERDDPLDDDTDGNDGDTITCPECHAEVYPDAPQCPDCGHWLIGGYGVQTWSPKRGIVFKIMAWLLILSFALAFLAALIEIFS